MIPTQDVISAIEYGMVLSALPCFTLLVVGIFWRLIHIFN